MLTSGLTALALFRITAVQNGEASGLKIQVKIRLQIAHSRIPIPVSFLIMSLNVKQESRKLSLEILLMMERLF